MGSFSETLKSEIETLARSCYEDLKESFVNTAQPVAHGPANEIEWQDNDLSAALVLPEPAQSPAPIDATEPINSLTDWQPFPWDDPSNQLLDDAWLTPGIGPEFSLDLEADQDDQLGMVLFSDQQLPAS
jgi:hypothetical protein